MPPMAGVHYPLREGRETSAYRIEMRGGGHPGGAAAAAVLLVTLQAARLPWVT